MKEWVFLVYEQTTLLYDKNNNKNIHWLKMLKEHELSAVTLQPSTDKNGIQDEYNIYRKGEIKRKIWIKAK